MHICFTSTDCDTSVTYDLCVTFDLKKAMGQQNTVVTNYCNLYPQKLLQSDSEISFHQIEVDGVGLFHNKWLNLHTVTLIS